MIRSLYGDDVGAEVRPQQETQGLDGVGAFGLPSGETELCELLVWLQHHHVRAKHNACLFLLVVVNLDCCVVGHSESDDLCLVALGSGGSTGTS